MEDSELQIQLDMLRTITETHIDLTLEFYKRLAEEGLPEDLVYTLVVDWFHYNFASNEEG